MWAQRITPRLNPGSDADERRQEGLAAARSTMAEIFDGPLEFTDLIVLDDYGS